jgi:CheY-like chemotaxis protein
MSDPKPAPKDRVVVIDDQLELRRLLGMILEEGGYEVHLAESGTEGLALVEKQRPSLIVLDLKMPGLDGWAVVDRLRATPNPPPVILISGIRDQITQGNLGNPIAGFLPKPFRVDEVLGMAGRAIEAARATQKDVDRRRAARRPFVAEGLLLDHEGEPLARGTVVNISRGGARFDLGVGLTIGESVRMAMTVPGAPEPIVVVGEIRWSSEGTLGIQFQDLSPDAAGRLEEILVDEPGPAA